MSSNTMRQRQAQATKAILFDSAIRLFREKGYDAVTIEDITSLAGTSKGSFYTYFRTKSGIIIEEFRAIDDFYVRWRKNQKRNASARDRMLAFVRAQMRHVRDKVGLQMLKLLYANNIIEPSTEKILIDSSRYLQTLVVELIAEGQASGEFRKDISADRLATLVNRSFRSVFLDWSISNDAFDLVKEGVDFCRNFVLPAIGSGAERRARDESGEPAAD